MNDIRELFETFKLIRQSMPVLCDIEAVTYRTIDTAVGYEQCMGS